MALTQLKTGAIADDAVTTDKLANAINTERTANTAKVSLTDNSVTLAKMAGGTDGQIITYDASGDPVAVGPGTDGQVLTSTGAGSPPAFETLSVPAGTTINNNADNRVITGSGTANTLNGEGSFTFDSGVADITGKLRIDIDSTSGAGSGNVEGIFLRNTNETDNNAVTIFAGADDYSNAASAINFINVDHSENKGAISFDTRKPGNYGERMRIDSSGNVTKPYQAMFQAKNNNNSSITISTGTIPFQTAINNVGSHYNTSNYRFTAPVNGVYLFYLGWYVISDTNHRVELRINGSGSVSPYIHGYSNSMGSSIPTASGSQFLLLSANDYVEVYTTADFYPYGTHLGWGGYLLG